MLRNIASTSSLDKAGHDQMGQRISYELKTGISTSNRILLHLYISRITVPVQPVQAAQTQQMQQLSK